MIRLVGKFGKWLDLGWGTRINLKLVRMFPILLVLLGVSGCKLKVDVEGSGAGLVTSDPAGLECGNIERSCEIAVSNSGLVLQAEAREGSVFVGWSGDCEGGEPACTLESKVKGNVIAHFEREESAVPDLNCGQDAAKAACLQPQQTPDYYVDQSVKYFLTMDSSVSPFIAPDYSPLVVRWEWPPWLLLTGYGKANMIWTDILLKLNPTAYASIDCRAFDVQPFGRCHVVFDYSGELCPIYEEFTFNDQGEMTFIEAWTDAPGWLPMEEGDYWAEGENVKRLATRVPGLGNATGLIDLNAAWMAEAAEQDADLANLVRRAKKPYDAWLKELLARSKEVAGGCHPNEGEAIALH